jgi:hypothetical protein
MHLAFAAGSDERTRARLIYLRVRSKLETQQQFKELP